MELKATTSSGLEVECKPIKIFDTTGIDGLISEQLANARIYDVHGKRLNRLQKGVNIIRLADGTIKKVFVK